jgi:hypothetical protein
LLALSDSEVAYQKKGLGFLEAFGLSFTFSLVTQLPTTPKLISVAYISCWKIEH